MYILLSEGGHKTLTCSALSVAFFFSCMPPWFNGWGFRPCPSVTRVKGGCLPTALSSFIFLLDPLD